MKSELKSRMTMALGGLALLIGAYVFLTYINPDLVDFNLRDIPLAVDSIETDEVDIVTE